MKHTLLLLGAALALPTLAFPELGLATEPAKPTHVVELFTSQGCSSCPPANRFVGELTEEPGTLVLTYGVTYWDYLGWKDTFGDKRFTQRQRDYRDAFGASNIYTPQIVLGGAAHSPRYSKKDVASMPLTRANGGDGVGLKVYPDGDASCFTANVPANAIVDIVTYTPGKQSVKVRRGENGGRTLTLTNVVSNVETIESGDVAAGTCFRPQPGLAYAALVHDGETARILDAAVLSGS